MAIEGESFLIDCTTEPMRSILSQDCSFYVYWWDADNGNGCLDNSDNCGKTVGGLCEIGIGETEDCWRSCMTVHDNYTLEIMPVVTEYEGIYTCKDLYGTDETHSMIVAGKIMFIIYFLIIPFSSKVFFKCMTPFVVSSHINFVLRKEISKYIMKIYLTI